MRIIAIAVLLLSMSVTDSSAQVESDDERAIRNAVETLFDAMRAGDGERVRSIFHPSATLGTAVAGPDSAFIRYVDIGQFADAVSAEREDVWDERIRALSVHVDGPLATAWTEYAFFIGPRFSHCGVNAMTFLRSQDGWQLLSVIDTRRTDNCDPSD